MEKIKELIQELKEKGDSRWVDLELMLANVNKISISTSAGQLDVIVNPHDDELWIGLTRTDGAELTVAYISVDEDEDGTADVVSRLWIGSQDDYYVKNNHEILRQTQL